MGRLTEEEKEHLMYQIYSFRYEDPWITNKKIAKLVNRSISTVNRYAKQAEKNIIVWNPHLRLKPHHQKAVLLSFEDKWKAFHQLKEKREIDYLCIYQGGWDIVAVYNRDMNFSQIPGFKRKIVEGLQGEIFTPKIEYTTWEDSFKAMKNLLNQKNISESKFEITSKDFDWSEDEWKMYYYFRPNLRKRFNTLRKEYPVSWRRYEKWKKNVRDYCTVLVSFFPEGYHSYDGLSLCLKTKYEKDIVNMFSHLPTTPNFHKIGKHLYATVYLPKDYQYQMRFYDLVSQMMAKGIITHYIDGKEIVMWHDRKMR